MSEEFITYMNKADLLERIRKDRAEFTTLWKTLSPAQMVQRPGVQSDWSVKDLIAHLVFWENLMIDTIEAVLDGKTPPNSEDIDTINAEVFEKNKDRGLADVLADWEFNEAKVEVAINRLTDEQINQPNAFPKLNDPLLYHIIGNTFGHLQSHRDDLLRYINSLA